MSQNALIVMAKRPFPGRTKTRLSPHFSPAEAAALYECFLNDAIDQVRSTPYVMPYLAYTPADDKTREYFYGLAPDFDLLPQEGSTLGERLENVLTACQSFGHQNVAAMNSDSPSLPLEYLAQAFTQLNDLETDVVLGPCEDGGYYLIGWKKSHGRLVREVEMSTSHVLADTLVIAKEEGLRVTLLPVWYDVDDLGDLSRVWEDLQKVGNRHSRTWQYLMKNRSAQEL